MGIAVGASLAAAGALAQGATRNPLADPGILGIESGAALAVVMAIFVLGVSSTAGYVPFALAGATAAGALVYVLGTRGRSRAGPINLALAGAAVAALCVALTSAVIVLDSAHARRVPVLGRGARSPGVTSARCATRCPSCSPASPSGWPAAAR